MTLVYARIADTVVADQYFTATRAVEADTPTVTSSAGERDTAGTASAASRQRPLHPTPRA